ncbi:MAG: YmdB family metallophosphoesterase [Candidatus Eisenbacteria bacterium]|nr:YmdB family metallophosphoesterase [Candidatus Eisenbacteria bacterium]
MRILFVADVFGAPGGAAVRARLPRVKRERDIDVTVVNGENAAGGYGLTPENAQELWGAGADAVTGGNHLWAQKAIVDFIARNPRLLRAVNFPPGTPGATSAVWRTDSGATFGVAYVLGRTFMAPLDDPFRAIDEELARPEWRDARVRLVEVHAEATSEKLALAIHLDGRVSAVIGTHTHVQTADARILPGGTAFLTDAGMTGPQDSIIGVEKDLALARFRNQLPVRFQPASGDVWMHGAVVDVDEKTGRARSIQAFKEPLLK